MSLEGANVERVTAQLDLHAEYAGRVDLRNSFTVHVRDRSGADYRYASADGDLDIGPAAGPLAIHLEALAVDTINDLLEEMRDVGYDGPHPLAAHTLQWFISDDLQAAQHRLDRRPPPKPVRVIATGVHVDEYPDPEHALAEAPRVVPRNRSPEDRADKQPRGQVAARLRRRKQYAMLSARRAVACREALTGSAHQGEGAMTGRGPRHQETKK